MLRKKQPGEVASKWEGHTHEWPDENTWKVGEVYECPVCGEVSSGDSLLVNAASEKREAEYRDAQK